MNFCNIFFSLFTLSLWYPSSQGHHLLLPPSLANVLCTIEPQHLGWRLPCTAAADAANTVAADAAGLAASIAATAAARRQHGRAPPRPHGSRRRASLEGASGRAFVTGTSFLVPAEVLPIAPAVVAVATTAAAVSAAPFVLAAAGTTALLQPLHGSFQQCRARLCGSHDRPALAGFRSLPPRHLPQDTCHKLAWHYASIDAAQQSRDGTGGASLTRVRALVRGQF